MSLKQWLGAAGAILSQHLGHARSSQEDSGAALAAVATLRFELAEMGAAKEQLSEALNDSEARRRELEHLLEPPIFSELSRWREKVLVLADLAAENPPGGLAAADIVPMVGLLSTVLDRLIVYRNALDRDQTGLAAALVLVIRVAQGYWWVTEGRGSYAWDDELYREETGRALSQVAMLAKQALVRSGTLATTVIQGREAPPSEPIPVAVAVSGLLIDAHRLEAVLHARWGSVVSATAFPLLPSFDRMGPAERVVFVQVARIVLEEVLQLASTGLDPLEVSVLTPTSRGDGSPVEA